MLNNFLGLINAKYSMLNEISRSNNGNINGLKLIVLLLRIGVFLTFLGHGIFAIQGNVHWQIYLCTVGFSSEIAPNLLFVIGILDVLVALIILFKPNKYVVLWAVIWAFSTALIRPISGESILAFVERGSNWIAPLVLLILISSKRFKND